jgi:hypothetical protein
MVINLNCIPDDEIHLRVFGAEDGAAFGVPKVDPVWFQLDRTFGASQDQFTCDVRIKHRPSCTTSTKSTQSPLSLSAQLEFNMYQKPTLHT